MIVRGHELPDSTQARAGLKDKVSGCRTQVHGNTRERQPRLSQEDAMSHCPTCTGWARHVNLAAANPNAIDPCPGCGHEAEIVALCEMVRELLRELILLCPETLHREQLAEFDAIRKEMP